MVKKKGVTIKVDENFFDIFEKERVEQQRSLRKKMGGMFNLTQKNFTAILAKRDFKFKIPEVKQPKIIRRRRK